MFVYIYVQVVIIFYYLIEIQVHRCDKCENYETLSRAALIAHMARCSLTNNNDVDNTENTKRLDRKLFECDVCNMKFSNGWYIAVLKVVRLYFNPR